MKLFLFLILFHPTCVSYADHHADGIDLPRENYRSKEEEEYYGRYDYRKLDSTTNWEKLGFLYKLIAYPLTIWFLLWWAKQAFAKPKPVELDRCPFTGEELKKK